MRILENFFIQNYVFDTEVEFLGFFRDGVLMVDGLVHLGVFIDAGEVVAVITKERALGYRSGGLGTSAGFDFLLHFLGGRVTGSDHHLQQLASCVDLGLIFYIGIGFVGLARPLGVRSHVLHGLFRNTVAEVIALHPVSGDHETASVQFLGWREKRGLQKYIRKWAECPFGLAELVKSF